ncbi:MAG: hypothetical protein ACR652_21190 [Methylocystis sp.]|uniref:hypothetical protein n=1 Tax=Methylocystis sp. TaxID=1911079 RepID=UPI003DA59B2F
MSEPLTKEDVQEIVDSAVTQLRQAIPTLVQDAMAGKIELTFGVDCKDPKERDAVREDMKFVRSLRGHARAGGEKIFLVAVGVLGTGFLYWVVAKVWPEGQRFLPHP